MRRAAVLLDRFNAAALHDLSPQAPKVSSQQRAHGLIDSLSRR